MEENCIAFKLNYCNGLEIDDSQDEHIGFRGLCSKNVMKANVLHVKRGWCSHEENLCKQCLDGKFSREELDEKWRRVAEDDSANDAGFCNESFTLRYWYAEAGWNSDDTPRRIANKDLAGHLCVLTTVIPFTRESTRFVFAMFIVKDVCDGGYNRADYVLADDYWRLEFRPNEVLRINFFDVYPSSSKFWGQGLFRYFDDGLAVKFLKRAVEVKRGTPEEDFAKEFLKQYPYK